MNKTVALIISMISIVTLTACSDKKDSSNLLTEVGVAPYELSESEQYILQSFGMENSSEIIAFQAPSEASSLSVNVYRLEQDESWNNISSGMIYLDEDQESSDPFSGNITIQLKDNYEIDYNLNYNGRSSFKTDQITLNDEIAVSTHIFLDEFQQIEMNNEIPVAIMVYDSGATMNSYSLQDYFEPSKFDGMDFVQVVTITFSDEE